MGGATDDDTDETRWLTYDELALARGITKASATRLAFRRRWRRHPGNDGTARVAVPMAELGTKQPEPHDGAPVVMDGVSHTIKALEGTIAVLHEQLEREQRLADEARAGLRVERETSRALEIAAAEERRSLLARIAQLEAKLEAEIRSARAPWWRRRPVFRRRARV